MGSAHSVPTPIRSATTDEKCAVMAERRCWGKVQVADPPI